MTVVSTSRSGRSRQIRAAFSESFPNLPRPFSRLACGLAEFRGPSAFVSWGRLDSNQRPTDYEIVAS